MLRDNHSIAVKANKRGIIKKRVEINNKRKQSYMLVGDSTSLFDRCDSNAGNKKKAQLCGAIYTDNL